MRSSGIGRKRESSRVYSGFLRIITCVWGVCVCVWGVCGVCVCVCVCVAFFVVRLPSFINTPLYAFFAFCYHPLWMSDYVAPHLHTVLYHLFTVLHGRFVYIAMSCVTILGRRNCINFDSAVSWLLKCRNFDGAFGCIPGAESHAGQSKSATTTV